MTVSRGSRPEGGEDFGVRRCEDGAVQFTLPEPPSANRWWRNVNGRMVTSKAAREYKAAVAQMGARRKIAGDVRVDVIWWRGRKSGDLDKRLGVVLDALQGVAYENDAHVVEINARRYEGHPYGPRIIVLVRAA